MIVLLGNTLRVQAEEKTADPDDWYPPGIEHMMKVLDETPSPEDPKEAADFAAIKAVLSFKIRDIAEAQFAVSEHVNSVIHLIDMGPLLASANNPEKLLESRRAFRRFAELLRRVAREYEGFRSDVALDLENRRLNNPTAAQIFLHDFLKNTRPQFAGAAALLQAEMHEATAADLQRALSSQEPKVVVNGTFQRASVFKEKLQILKERYERGETVAMP